MIDRHLAEEDVASIVIESEVHGEQPPASFRGSLSISSYGFEAPIFSDRQCKYIQNIYDCVAGSAKFWNLGQGTDILPDEDGDLDPPRKALCPISSGSRSGSILIQHQISTNLDDVGFQVWKGAFLLCDLALSLGSGLSGLSCLELGCGTGLTGICLSILCADAFLTDRGRELLANCESNVELNASVYKMCRTRVKQLHWGQPLASLDHEAKDERHKWSHQDLLDLRDVHLIWAADVVYDTESTRVFLETACMLLAYCQASGKQPLLFTSAEKRLNCSIGDFHPRAHEYENFLKLVEDVSWIEKGRLYRLVASELSVDLVPQWFQYQRRKDLVLLALHLLETKVL